MIGAPGLRKMQFKKVKDVGEKNKVIAEFLSNRKILRQRLIDEKLGKQELVAAAEKAQRPVTAAVEKAQKQTDEKQDKVIEQLQDNQDKITQAVDTLSEAVSKSGGVRPPEPYEWGAVTESESDTDDPFPELSDVEQKEAKSVFPEKVTKRLLKMNIDPSLSVIVDDSMLQRVFEDQTKFLKDAKGGHNKAVQSNKLKALEEYQKVVKSKPPSLDDAQPFVLAPLPQEAQQQLKTGTDVTLDPYWFTRDIETTLRRVGIDPTFAKVPSEDDLYSQLNMDTFALKNMPENDSIKNRVKVIRNYIDNLPQIRAYSAQQKTVTDASVEKVTLNPFWFTNDTKTVLKRMNIDTTFAKMPSDKDLKVRLKALMYDIETSAFPIPHVKDERDVIQKYLTDLPQIQAYSDQLKTGTSLKPRPNILKLSTNGTFGNLTIDPTALMGGRLVAFNKSKKVISRRIDDDFVHLLTKRFNPRRNYSTKSRQTFDRLIDLAGIHRASSKSGKCAPVKYYKSPDELCERLGLLMASKNAGNNNTALANEAVGILDQLLNDQAIDTNEYKALHESIVSAT